MTAITQNLPWFISDLGVSIIGQKCYTSLVENLNIGDVDCLKYSLSKGLGLGIVVGGSIMKVPQLMLILNARSARGLSLPAYVLETLAYAITTTYSFRNNFPFSTYGENLFLTLQNTIITLLIIYYPTASPRKSQNVSSHLTIATVATAASALALYVFPKEVLSVLQLATLPLSLFSKLPQIRQNSRAQSTGQLSAFAVVSQIAGCLARLFTTATEVGDLIVTAGFALALVLNIVLGAQLWMYWGKEEKVDFEMTHIGAVSEKQEQWVPERQSRVDVVVTPKSPVPRHMTASPSGRKWARKVD
ncbi:mannose-P-dolichol utilization defect 1 protein [Leucogyrophana mollusca]|uniref:Mannose-P-dolichol utilization defect 1 protein n=1 Tax=Leucogyrophana mollusca TaxID=85980 RepID=A0ACB8BRP0_9AGAM|nr:mannose-P-dolichol utilization defect 1 protein [Leucogyrophana mollusca]